MGRVPGSQGTWGSLHFENVLEARHLYFVTLNPVPPEDWRGVMPQTIPLSRITRPIRVSRVRRIKPTILIAEDSADSREMMQMLLGLRGYSVVMAADGCEAVELALESFPDLILLDLELPGVDGLSVARHLRRRSDFKNIPIIILSGHDPMEHRQSALDAGCTDYLLKPLDFEKLDSILQNEVPL